MLIIWLIIIRRHVSHSKSKSMNSYIYLRLLFRCISLKDQWTNLVISLFLTAQDSNMRSEPPINFTSFVSHGQLPQLPQSFGRTQQVTTKHARFPVCSHNVLTQFWAQQSDEAHYSGAFAVMTPASESWRTNTEQFHVISDAINSVIFLNNLRSSTVPASACVRPRIACRYLSFHQAEVEAMRRTFEPGAAWASDTLACQSGLGPVVQLSGFLSCLSSFLS